MNLQYCIAAAILALLLAACAESPSGPPPLSATAATAALAGDTGIGGLIPGGEVATLTDDLSGPCGRINYVHCVALQNATAGMPLVVTIIVQATDSKALARFCANLSVILGRSLIGPVTTVEPSHSEVTLVLTREEVFTIRNMAGIITINIDTFDQPNPRCSQGGC
jgi:hypothetical protein